jgi:hypothetical protein
MKTDKEFALDILRWLEEFALRNTILEQLLKRADVKDWKAKAARMYADRGARQLLHEEFAAWHEAILSSPDISDVSREILERFAREWPE